MERGGNIGELQYVINAAGCNRTARHAIKARFVEVLSDDKTAPVLNGAQSQTAICAGARQDHTDRACATVLGHRAQQEVKWQPRTVAGQRCRQMQGTVAHGQEISRWNDVDMIG